MLRYGRVLLRLYLLLLYDGVYVRLCQFAAFLTAQRGLFRKPRTAQQFGAFLLLNAFDTGFITFYEGIGREHFTGNAIADQSRF